MYARLLLWNFKSYKIPIFAGKIGAPERYESSHNILSEIVVLEALRTKDVCLDLLLPNVVG